MFNSYQSQCLCMFSEAVIKMYGRHVHVQNVFYQPRDLSAKLSFKHLRHLNQIMTKNGASENAFSIFKAGFNFAKQVKIVTEISRIISPALDSKILAQYFTTMTSNYNFNQICNKMSQKMAFFTMPSKNSAGPRGLGVNYQVETQLQGLLIKLQGRIPKEPVRPRKTIQHKMLGTNSKTHNLKNAFKKNPISFKTHSFINPELGSFSIWVRTIV